MQFFSCIMLRLAEIYFMYMEDSKKRSIAEGVKKLVPEAKEINVFVKEKNNRVALAPNIMVFQTFAYLAATTLKPSSNKVLMLFFANSAYENYIGMDIVAIAEKLEVSERTVINALKELTKHNIIIKTDHPNDKRRNDYFLNPFASWKGNSASRKKMIQIIPENQLSLFGIKPKGLIEREKTEIKGKLPLHQMDLEVMIGEVENEEESSNSWMEE